MEEAGVDQPADEVAPSRAGQGGAAGGLDGVDDLDSGRPEAEHSDRRPADEQIWVGTPGPGVEHEPIDAVRHGPDDRNRPMERTATQEPEPTVAEAEPDEDDDLVEEELLVEEISIDGMCGVY
jgi:mycofactocin precursor